VNISAVWLWSTSPVGDNGLACSIQVIEKAASWALNLNKKSMPLLRIDPIRVVIDTNVWLSALIFGGKPRQVVELFIFGLIAVVISEEIFTAMRRKVRQKFPEFISDLKKMELLIRADAEIVLLGEITINISRDPNDNHILETAILGNCTHIITGDKDLRDINKYKKLKIVTPSEFLESNKAY